jgi:hypothetical protein
MSITWQYAFNVLFGVTGALTGWIIHILWSATQKLATDLRTLEQQLPETYARRDDVAGALDRIENTVIRIDNKLDNKADKQ